MATTSAATTRMSFAKVAASAGGEVATKTYPRPVVATPSRDKQVQYTPAEKIEQTDETAAHALPSKSSTKQETNVDGLLSDSLIGQEYASKTAGAQPPRDSTEQKLIDAVKAMDVTSPMPSLVVNGSGLTETRRRQFAGDSFPAEMFQRADSESELGTKPPSLDGKSITSGTTFALDEKESLRPDDSASVKAAEDDDTFSGRGSIVAGSRIGSEAAARAYRDYNPLERKLLQPMLERQAQGSMTPQSGSSGPQAVDDEKADPSIPAVGPEGFNLFYRQTPDEKLLEALDSPKDRIFLLKLEQDVIEFVKDSKEPFIDLPPSNSFCRMLTHKLADYYHMTHQVDAGAVLGAVRIFRTPFCRLPPPLISISNPPTTGNTPPPPSLPAMKIMRRGGDTGPSPSKAASETGSDGKEKSQAAKEKLSREEREAAYNRARERIFGKDDKSGEGIEIDDGNEMSRSSSVSTKDRAGIKKSKPKQRRDDSDTFDVRSQYTPIFQQPQVQVPTWAPANQYAVPQHGYPVHGQPAYSTQMPAQYVQSPQYNPVMMHTGAMPTYPNMAPQQYPAQNQSGYVSHNTPITPYGSTARSPPVSQNQWQQPGGYSAQYQPQQAPQPRASPNSIPYAFGQLPSTANPADPKSQHPIPGSFNRHAFNPKTQSFVPGASGIPVPQSFSQHGSPHHGSPHHGSPHLNYNAYTPPQQYGNPMGYNMARQGSNNSIPSYHASPHQAHKPIMVSGIPQPQGLPQPYLHQQQNPQPNGLPGSHLPNYGNPSTLPPKPPTGV